MITPGQTLENPVTGERFTFTHTAGSTNGELLAFDFALQPGGAVPIPHVHPIQTERVGAAQAQSFGPSGRAPKTGAYVGRGEARPAYERAFAAQWAINAGRSQAVGRGRGQHDQTSDPEAGI
jgi:hypothetical protein